MFVRQASGNLKDHVQALDELIWEKELGWTRAADLSGLVCEAIRARDGDSCWSGSMRD